MLVLLRILFGFALFVVFGRAIEVAGPNPQTEGPTDAGYVALAVFIGIANAVVWAPFIGRLMADPLTGAFTVGHPGDFRNHLLQFAHKLANRRRRRLALFFAFLEGVRHPDLPGAFVLGMSHARPGSWLEKVFAREVWRFENAENCLRAWKILKARGIEPGLHPRAEVNLLLLSHQREIPAPADVLAVPPAPPPPRPRRHASIQLFEGAPAGETGPRVPREATPAVPPSSVSSPDLRTQENHLPKPTGGLPADATTGVASDPANARLSLGQAHSCPTDGAIG